MSPSVYKNKILGGQKNTLLFLLPFVGQQLKSVPCRVRSRSEHPPLNKLKSAPLHALVCADEGSKVRMLTRWKEKKNARAG